MHLLEAQTLAVLHFVYPALWTADFWGCSCVCFNFSIEVMGHKHTLSLLPLCVFWGFELSSSHLCSKYSCPWSHLLGLSLSNSIILLYSSSAAPNHNETHITMVETWSLMNKASCFSLEFRFRTRDHCFLWGMIFLFQNDEPATLLGDIWILSWQKQHK